MPDSPSGIMQLPSPIFSTDPFHEPMTMPFERGFADVLCSAPTPVHCFLADSPSVEPRHVMETVSEQADFRIANGVLTRGPLSKSFTKRTFSTRLVFDDYLSVPASPPAKKQRSLVNNI
ncbi:Uncharacterized protein PBTT_00542 [Plasmodiophora brassicae]